MNLSECKGDWALVTGASSGIGREFAVQLAAAGLNLVLVARRKAALDELAFQLSRQHSVRALAIALDLARPNAVDELCGALDAGKVRIRLLINNAAVGRWGRFEDAPAETYQAMLQLNVIAMVILCHRFLPTLASFPTSAVINVSSAACYQPVPFMAVYAASKSFVQSFSQALYGEWRERGVLVQTLVPGPTATEFDATAGAYESALKERGTPQEVVRDSLVQLDKRNPVATNAKGTYKQRLFAGLFPPKIVISTVGRMFTPAA